MKNETAKSADYKMVKYKDPATGKIKFRKVKHDDSIVKQEEGYLGSKGEKGRDKGNAGKFDKNTAYSHAKTHNGVVHKDTSGSYLVKHGRGKNVSEEPVAELSTKTLQSFADKSWKNPKRAQGVKTAAGKIVKKALEKESTYTAKVPKKHDPSKDISVADYKKKTGKKTVSLKHLTKNTHVNPFTEESFDLDEAAINFRKLHQEIMAYAKKHGGIDKEDFAKVASYIKEIGDNQNKPDRANLRFATMKAFVAGMDTDPRDKVYSWLKKYGMFKNGKMVQESESVDEVYRKPPTPIGKGSSAKYKEAEAEYDREKSFARMRNQRKPIKKESSIDELSPQTKKSYLDKSSGDAERHQRISRDYSSRSSDNVPGMDNWHKKMASAHARKSKNRAIGQSRAQESAQESVSSSDYHHTSEPSKFASGHRPKLVHKKTGKVMYLGGHSFKKKETAKDAATAYMKGYQKGGDKAAQTHLHNFKKNNEGKTFESFRRELLDELTDKQRAEIAKRKAANQAKRGARRGPSKGTKSSEGDWTADQQKSAKALSFEIGKNDKHDAVHKTLAKAADASHPSLGGRKVKVKINGKSKEMAHKDLQHAVDLHKRLPLGKKAAVMNLIRDKGHDGVTAAANHFRKTYK